MLNGSDILESQYLPIDEPGNNTSQANIHKSQYVNHEYTGEGPGHIEHHHPHQAKNKF